MITINNKYLSTMTTNRHYQTPTVLKEVTVQLERDFLAKSIVDESMLIYSDGQELEQVDASSEDFDWNNNWEWE